MKILFIDHSVLCTSIYIGDINDNDYSIMKLLHNKNFYDNITINDKILPADFLYKYFLPENITPWYCDRDIFTKYKDEYEYMLSNYNNGVLKIVDNSNKHIGHVDNVIIFNNV